MRRPAGWQHEWRVSEMARSRNIKPSIMENEDLAELQPVARLLFVYLWMLADREGRLEDRPKRIAGRALPYDRDVDVDGLLESLAGAGFITRYMAGGFSVIQVNNFLKHQSPHVRESASELPGIEQSTTKVVTQHNQGTAEASPRSPDSLFPLPDSLSPLPEEKPCSPSASASADEGFAKFWERYPKKVAKPQALKAWKKIKPSGQVLVGLKAGLEKQRASADWLKDGGQFIPHPATWLNSRRWEDEPAGNAAAEQPASTIYPPKPGDTRIRFGAPEVFTETIGWIPDVAA